MARSKLEEAALDVRDEVASLILSRGECPLCKETFSGSFAKGCAKGCVFRKLDEASSTHLSRDGDAERLRVMSNGSTLLVVEVGEGREAIPASEAPEETEARLGKRVREDMLSLAIALSRALPPKCWAVFKAIVSGC